MSRDIKYRQLVKNECQSAFGCAFHYWGYIDGAFVCPLGRTQGGESDQFTGLTDKNGAEIFLI